jgi:hypothetical protein
VEGANTFLSNQGRVKLENDGHEEGSDALRAQGQDKHKPIEACAAGMNRGE